MHRSLLAWSLALGLVPLCLTPPVAATPPVPEEVSLEAFLLELQVQGVTAVKTLSSPSPGAVPSRKGGGGCPTDWTYCSAEICAGCCLEWGGWTGSLCAVRDCLCWDA
jgi:hypothetical protein